MEEQWVGRGRAGAGAGWGAHKSPNQQQGATEGCWQDGHAIEPGTKAFSQPRGLRGDSPEPVTCSASQGWSWAVSCPAGTGEQGLLSQLPAPIPLTQQYQRGNAAPQLTPHQLVPARPPQPHLPPSRVHLPGHPGPGRPSQVGRAAKPDLWGTYPTWQHFHIYQDELIPA